VGHGPSRHGHFGARDGSPPTGGMRGTNRAPDASASALRPSGRGEDPVFGPLPGRSDEDDDCLARDRLLQLAVARRSHEPSTDHLRVADRLAHRMRFLRGSRRWARRSILAMRARVARRRRTNAFGRANESAASGLFLTYAGNRGRMERTSSNHRTPLFGACAGIANRSLRRCDAISSENRAPSGARTDAVDFSRSHRSDAERFSRGGSTGIPSDPSGPMWDAAEAFFLRECAGAKRDRSRSVSSGKSNGRTGSATAFGL